MNPAQHKHYIDYREMFVYFGRKMVMLSASEFLEADSELQGLKNQSKPRSARDEARLRELERILFRD
jgi:hypothetical protein